MWEKVIGYLAGGSKGLLGGVEGILNATITTDKERLEASNKLTQLINEHQESVTQAILQEQQAQTENTKDARSREVELNKSQYSGWLGKNTASILAYIVVTLTFILMGFLLFGAIPKEKENLAFAIQGFLAGACMTVLGYYFGSTHGSQKKDDTIKEMASTNQSIGLN